MTKRTRFPALAIFPAFAPLLTGCVLNDGPAPCGNRPDFHMNVDPDVNSRGTTDSQGNVRIRIGQEVALWVFGLGAARKDFALADDCPVADANWTTSSADVAIVVPKPGVDENGWARATLRGVAQGTAQISLTASWNAGTSGTTAATYDPLPGSGLPRNSFIPVIVQ